VRGAPGNRRPYRDLPIFSKLPKPNAEQEVEWSRAGQMLYAAHGVTTAH